VTVEQPTYVFEATCAAADRLEAATLEGSRQG
jgi:hypothetical protein